MRLITPSDSRDVHGLPTSGRMRSRSFGHEGETAVRLGLG